MSGPKAGQWQARITVPSGGWSYGGTHSGSIAAGTYYLTELLAAITGDVDFALTATGQVAVSHASTFSLTWGATALRDLLGFTGPLSGGNSYTSPNHAQALWRPGVAKVTPYGDNDAGDLISDGRSSMAPTGLVYSFHGNLRRELNGVRYQGLHRKKTRTSAEVLVNESLETFWRDGIIGEAAWGTPGGPVRLYWDETDNDDHVTLACPLNEWRSLVPGQMREGWTGRWNVEMPVFSVLSQTVGGVEV